VKAPSGSRWFQDILAALRCRCVYSTSWQLNSLLSCFSLPSTCRSLQSGFCAWWLVAAGEQYVVLAKQVTQEPAACTLCMHVKYKSKKVTRSKNPTHRGNKAHKALHTTPPIPALKQANTDTRCCLSYRSPHNTVCDLIHNRSSACYSLPCMQGDTLERALTAYQTVHASTELHVTCQLGLPCINADSASRTTSNGLGPLETLEEHLL
jgi:hypothetical protein